MAGDHLPPPSDAPAPVHVHSHGHSHGHGLDDRALSPRLRRVMWAIVVACAVVIALGVVALWPGGSDGTIIDPGGLELDPVPALVTDVEIAPCEFDPLLVCRFLEVVPSEGPFDGVTLPLDQPAESSIADGDRILVVINELPDGSVVLSFYDFERSTPLLLLLLVFVVAILLLGRLRGFGALAGLSASLAVIVLFALPALLEGSNAVAVALVSAGVIAYLALFLAHGFNMATATALLSTLAALTVTGILAVVFVWGSKLTGLADESVGFLDALGTPVDPRGLLLAGILIGALGVLDDVTVTQVSAVWELKRAAPHTPFAELYRSGVRIGRDHISSTVNTLFLAYAGASLPLLLLFKEAGQSIGSVATREVVAVEIVRALVGSIGLVSAVPISTALAAKVISTTSFPVAAAPDDAGSTS